MPKINHKVELTEEEMDKLKKITHKGAGESVRTIMHANILQFSNDGNPNKKTDREIAEMFEISPTTVNMVRSTYANEGIEAALNRKTRISPPHISKITGEFEAYVIAMALGLSPKCTAKWTLRLLAEYSEERKYIISILHSAIGEMLNSNQVKPHLSKYWCIPKEHDAEYVMHMEDVLGIYKRASHIHVLRAVGRLASHSSVGNAQKG